MPVFTPYYWSVKTDIIYNSNSTISLKNYGRYVSGDYLEYISYYSGNYLTITGNDAPTSYYFNNSSQKNNIRINTQKKSKILFDSNISGDTFTLFSGDVGIYDVTMIGNKSSNIDVSLTLNDVNLTGNIGNNRLIGNAFNNIIDGKGGADTLIGGAGNDTYIIYSFNDTIVENLNEGTDTVIVSIKGLNTYTLPDNVENARGAVFGKRINGNSLNNVIDGSYFTVIDGGAGEDTLIGSYSENTYVVDNVNDVIIEPTINYKPNIDTVESSVNWTLGNDLENLTLTGSSNLIATGNSLNNTIIGNSGNNIIDGKRGADLMMGGFGDDTYYVDDVKDFVLEYDNQGNDTVISEISFYINSINYYGIDNITLTEHAGTWNQDISGNYKSNILIGNSANNIISGGANSSLAFSNDVYIYKDTLIGGAGNDTYYVESDFDTVVELINEGIDTIFSCSGYTLPSNVENLTLLYSYSKTAQYYGIGNSLDNIIIGSGFADIIEGKEGNDIITGRTGNDIINGGAGNDTFIINNGDALIGRKTAYMVSGIFYNTPSFDTITGLEIGSDIIDGHGNSIKTPTSVGELILPNSSFDVDNIISVLNSKFVQNGAILFTYNQRTFLGIDDGSSGYNPNKDSIIEITGYSGNLSDLRVI